jgi:hypothetical protein
MTNFPNNIHYEEDEISLLDIFVTLAESWRLLAFGPLLAGVLAGALSFLWPKMFESVAIVRLTEEEVALLHATPVLDSLIEKFGYLEKADGIKEDARKILMKDLAFSSDKKTKLATVVAKGGTPDSAQALGKAALGVLLQELQLKGREKEAILQEIALNNQLIAEGVLLLERQSGRKNSANGQIANLKLNNLDLSLKLQAKGQEVFAQEPSFPQRMSAPNRGYVVLITMLASSFVLLLFVLIRKATCSLKNNPESASKLEQIKNHLFGKPDTEV